MIYTLANKTALAQATEERSLVTMIAALAVVVVVAGVLLAVLSIYRRRLHGEASVIRDFTLVDLRDLHREGKLSDEEFERAKAKLVSSVQARLAKEKKPTLAERPFEGEPKE